MDLLKISLKEYQKDYAMGDMKIQHRGMKKISLQDMIFLTLYICVKNSLNMAGMVNGTYISHYGIKYPFCQ